MADKSISKKFNFLWNINQTMKAFGQYNIVDNMSIVITPGSRNNIPIVASYLGIPGKGIEDLKISGTVNGPELFSTMKDIKTAVASLDIEKDGIHFTLDEDVLAKKRPDRTNIKKWLAWKEPSSMEFDYPLDSNNAREIEYLFKAACFIDPKEAKTKEEYDMTPLVPELLVEDAPVLIANPRKNTLELCAGFKTYTYSTFQMRLDRSMLLRLTKDSKVILTTWICTDGKYLVCFKISEPEFIIHQWLKIIY
jgi:hypothetical protein